ncbi:MAG: aspartyl/asparaginyl beta-hydroxylase [Caulobacteraceae bacterium]|jgi:aspartate beta-hydroxylase|nr:aspartyl/asparaginyl beta-hydroxylase [Caulobacteraceae bacterium]
MKPGEDNPLFDEAARATAEGPSEDAARLTREAEAAISKNPGNASLWFNLADVLRRLRRTDEELTALEQGLALQPGRTDALLRAGSIYEARGAAPVAAACYRTALASIQRGPPPAPHLRPMLERAASVVAANTAALETFLDGRLKILRARHANEPLARFDRCMATVLRKRRVFRPTPSFMYFPNLPAYEFYDRDDFPWLASIEAATDDIRSELMSVLADDHASLRPYITTRKEGGVTAQKPPDDVWKELNESPRWSAYFLWQEGVAYPQNIARCSKTVAALESWPRCDLPRTAPTAMFSLLDARTRIPPHVGVTNVRLVVHVPLIVPPGCRFRVGAETRAWEPGKALVFDDSIEHEAWNDSDQLRAVLIVDIWNPFLTAAERDMVRVLTDGVGEFYGSLPDYV